MAFRGHFEHSLDAKNRLSIPARFRAEFSSGLVLAKDSDSCIAVRTTEGHEETFEAALAQLSPLSSEYKTLQRFHQSNSFDVELDGSGRVVLDARLLAHAGIEREVVVAGVGDHLEIWSRDGWNTLQTELEANIEGVTESLGHPS
jgi:MraZ protein